MSNDGSLESILIVYQNPIEGREADYDDWYTNVHIRDAMRLDGAIATQRFIRSRLQPVQNGQPIDPGYFAHTIYEWESAKRSVDGHNDRAGTPRMEISADAEFKGLRDYFYRPVALSHAWTREQGFRRGVHVLSALITAPVADEAAFADWFSARHVPDTLGLPGFASAGLFSLHEEQSLPIPTRYKWAAIYGLDDAQVALDAWTARQDAKSETDLTRNVQERVVGCWQPRIQRLRAEQVVNPDTILAGEEQRARAIYAGCYLKQDDLKQILYTI